MIFLINWNPILRKFDRKFFQKKFCESPVKLLVFQTG